jgi:hypothetical protein
MAGRTVIGYQVIIYVWVVGRIKGGGAVGRRERSKEASKEEREQKGN